MKTISRSRAVAALALVAVAILLATAISCKPAQPGVPDGEPSPGVPILLAVSGNGTGTIHWMPISGATSYNLYWSAHADVGVDSGNPIEGATSPCTINGLANGTDYFVILTSVISGIEGDPSPTAKISPAAPASTVPCPPGWWRKNTVFEHLWISSFQDGGSPGSTMTRSEGDLDGITRAIEDGYFNRLGVNALWLSPVSEAVTLGGYDITDYMNVAERYGNNQDLSDLLSAAHGKGIRVIFDFVPGYVNEAHPWFVHSASSLESPFRDWFVWHAEPAPDHPFADGSGWQPSGTGPAGWLYYSFFGKGHADLNFRNGQTARTVRDVANAWLDFGFDGMRVDAVRHLVEGFVPDSFADQAETHLWFEDLRAEVVDGYSSGTNAKFMIAEAWIADREDMDLVTGYLRNGASPEFNAVLDFIAPSTLVDALNSADPAAAVGALKAHFVDDCMAVRAAGGIFGVFQSNHDQVADRPVTSYEGSGRKVYLAAALSILGQGMPILYYGNEIAMAGSMSNWAGLSLPFDWEKQRDLEAAADSVWNWHRVLNSCRTGYGAWDDPEVFALTASDPSVFAFLICGATGKKAVLVANLGQSGSTTFTVPVSGASANGLIGSTASDSLSAGALGVSDLPALSLRAYALDDPTAPVFLDHDPPDPGTLDTSVNLPPPDKLYLRGDVTPAGWDAVDGVNLMVADGLVYSLSASLQGGTTYNFKFADATWEVYNYGNGTPRDAAASTAIGAYGTNAGNITFAPVSSGSYTFFFGFSTSISTYWVQ